MDFEARRHAIELYVQAELSIRQYGRRPCPVQPQRFQEYVADVASTKTYGQIARTAGCAPGFKDPKRLPTFWHVDSTYLHVRRAVPLA